MDKAAQDPLIRSFERHLRAENRSERTIAAYLTGLRQADAFLRARGTPWRQAATRADLEAFLANVLSRRSASTAATYYKPLKLMYGWLAEEDAPRTAGPTAASRSKPHLARQSSCRCMRAWRGDFTTGCRSQAETLCWPTQSIARPLA